MGGKKSTFLGAVIKYLDPVCEFPQNPTYPPSLCQSKLSFTSLVCLIYLNTEDLFLMQNRSFLPEQNLKNKSHSVLPEFSLSQGVIKLKICKHVLAFLLQETQRISGSAQALLTNSQQCWEGKNILGINNLQRFLS